MTPTTQHFLSPPNCFLVSTHDDRNIFPTRKSQSPSRLLKVSHQLHRQSNLYMRQMQDGDPLPQAGFALSLVEVGEMRSERVLPRPWFIVPSKEPPELAVPLFVDGYDSMKVDMESNKIFGSDRLHVVGGLQNFAGCCVGTDNDNYSVENEAYQNERFLDEKQVSIFSNSNSPRFEFEDNLQSQIRDQLKSESRLNYNDVGIVSNYPGMLEQEIYTNYQSSNHGIINEGFLQMKQSRFMNHQEEHLESQEIRNQMMSDYALCDKDKGDQHLNHSKKYLQFLRKNGHENMEQQISDLEIQEKNISNIEEQTEVHDSSNLTSDGNHQQQNGINEEKQLNSTIEKDWNEIQEKQENLWAEGKLAEREQEHSVPSDFDEGFPWWETSDSKETASAVIDKKYEVLAVADHQYSAGDYIN
ncbi:hypothetical protein HK096_000322 [Nowakowskiella sp. JEL0078]|nr:hypothetical protein HK096_000322 [Nowakowskiella sp. JEL0078]